MSDKKLRIIITMELPTMTEEEKSDFLKEFSRIAGVPIEEIEGVDFNDLRCFASFDANEDDINPDVKEPGT